MKKMKPDEIPYKPLTVLLLMIILCIQLWSMFYPSDTGFDSRLDRVEHIMAYDWYGLSPSHYIDDNSTLGDVKNLYLNPAHKGYKELAINMALGYVCDGDGERTIEHFLK